MKILRPWSTCVWLTFFLFLLVMGACSESDDSQTDGDTEQLEQDIVAENEAEIPDGDSVENEAELEPEAEAEITPVCLGTGDSIGSRPFTIIEGSSFYIDPYLMHTTETSTVIMWETETECLGTLNYGLAADALTQQKQDSAPVKIHELRIEGLTSNTHYYYNVISCDVTTPTFDFYTAPPQGHSGTLHSLERRSIPPGNQRTDLSRHG